MEEPKEKPPKRPRELTFTATLIRLGKEAAIVAFLILLHAGLSFVVKRTEQEGEVWAQVLLGVTALYGTVGVVVVGFFELITVCWEAGSYAWRRIKGA